MTRDAFVCKLIAVILFGAKSLLAIADAPHQSIQNYLNLGQQVIAELNQRTPNADTIIENITQMLEEAKPAVAAFANKNTQCKEQLTHMLNLYPEIDRWSAQEIRRNIEAARSLPQAEGCYAARDIVAHPAIVRAIARTNLSSVPSHRLIHEIDEAIEHMQEIASSL